MSLGEVVTIAHTKGGSGKSSLASNLAYSLAERGFSVLVIDLDGQGSQSAHLGGVTAKRKLRNGVEIVLDSGALLRDFCTLDEARITDVHPGLDVVPADELSLDNAVAHLEAQGPLGQLRLYELLDQTRLNYDFTIIDTPGHQGTALAVALIASTGILIPVIPEAGPVSELRTVLNGIRALSESTIPLEVYGLVRMRVGGNSNYRRIAEEQARAIANEYQVPLLRNKIPEDARFGEAQLLGVPVRAHDKSARSAIAFKFLTEEFLERKGWRSPLEPDTDTVPTSTTTSPSASSSPASSSPASSSAPATVTASSALER